MRLFPTEEPDGSDQANQRLSADRGQVDVVLIPRHGLNHYLSKGITKIIGRHDGHDRSHELRHHVNREEALGENRHGNSISRGATGAGENRAGPVDTHEHFMVDIPSSGISFLRGGSSAISPMSVDHEVSDSQVHALSDQPEGG